MRSSRVTVVLLYVLVMTLLCSSALAGAAYYVDDTNGNDADGNSDPNYPFQTIAAALNAASGGVDGSPDVVHVNSGEYTTGPIDFDYDYVTLEFDANVVVTAVTNVGHPNDGNAPWYNLFRQRTGNSMFEISFRTGITIDGDGTIFDMNRQGYLDPNEMLPWDYDSNDPNHVAPTYDLDHMHVIHMWCSENVTIDGVTCLNSTNDGICIDRGHGAPNDAIANKTIKINDVVCDHSSRWGMAVMTVDGLDVNDITLKNASWDIERGINSCQGGIDFEGETDQALYKNVRIYDATIENNPGKGIHVTTHTMVGNPNDIDVVIENAVISSPNIVDTDPNYLDPELEGIGIVAGPFYDDGPGGSVTFKNCDVSNVREGITIINGNDVNLVFENCDLENLTHDPNVVDSYAIRILTNTWKMSEHGGATFINCSVTDDYDRPVIDCAKAYDTDRNITDLYEIHGDIRVSDPNRNGDEWDWGESSPMLHNVDIVFHDGNSFIDAVGGDSYWRTPGNWDTTAAVNDADVDVYLGFLLSPADQNCDYESPVTAYNCHYLFIDANCSLTQDQADTDSPLTVKNLYLGLEFGGGEYLLNGGKLVATKDIFVGYSAGGKFTIADAAAVVEVDGNFTLGEYAEFDITDVNGGTITMTGASSAFDIDEGANCDDVDGLDSLKLVFNGEDNGSMKTIEAAGLDVGDGNMPDANAFDDPNNFVIDELVIGESGASSVRLKLFNRHDNSSTVTEAVYVNRLTLNDGADIIVNGQKLFYLRTNGEADNVYTPRTLCYEGDLNTDGAVDIIDLNMLLIDWGKTGAAISDPRADASGDGTVDIIDLNYVLIDWGKGGPVEPPSEIASSSKMTVESVDNSDCNELDGYVTQDIVANIDANSDWIGSYLMLLPDTPGMGYQHASGHSYKRPTAVEISANPAMKYDTYVTDGTTEVNVTDTDAINWGHSDTVFDANEVHVYYHTMGNENGEIPLARISLKDTATGRWKYVMFEEDGDEAGVAMTGTIQGGQLVLDSYFTDEGIGSDWETADNWSSHAVPDNPEGNVYIGDAFYGTNLDAYYTASSESHTILNLYIDANSSLTQNQASASYPLTVDDMYIGETGVGSYTLSGGSLDANGVYLGYNAAADGVVTVSGGTLEADSIAYIGYYGNGTLDISGTADVDFLSDVYVGRHADSNGTINVSAGSLAVTDKLYLGYNDTGTLNLSGTGGINLSDTLVMGNSSSGEGNLNISGGTLDSTSYVGVGAYGTGDVTQTGGDVNVSSLYIGLDAGTGTYAISGGTLYTPVQILVAKNGTGTLTQTGGDVDVNSYFYVGSNAGSTGTYNVSDGNLTVGSDIMVGRYGTGDVNQTGGNVDCSTRMFMGRFSGSSGTYAISGGTLDLTTYLDIGYSGAGNFTQTGGTVTAGSALRIANLTGSSGSSYTISGGTVNPNNLQVGLGDAGTFTIGDDAAVITVGGDFTLGADANLVVTDANSVITLSGVGSDFVIDADTTTTNVTGLQNLHLVFDANDSGGVVKTIECAGEFFYDYQMLSDYDAGNFTIKVLEVGTSSGGTCTLKLVDNEDHGWWEGEALWVERLKLNSNATINLNGLRLYYYYKNDETTGSARYLPGPW